MNRSSLLEIKNCNIKNTFDINLNIYYGKDFPKVYTINSYTHGSLNVYNYVNSFLSGVIYNQDDNSITIVAISLRHYKNKSHTLKVRFKIIPDKSFICYE